MKSVFVTGVFFGMLIILCVVAGIVLNVRTENRFAHVRCSQFLTQEEAQLAYATGAQYLDGDGDGVACENLLK